MTDLFEVYKLAFLLTPVAAILLSLIGCHLVSRDQGLQLMALSQAALLGGILGEFFHENLACLLISTALFLIVKTSFHFFKIIKNQVYIVFYLSFIAFSYILLSLFPELDSHFASGFFGDIVSLSNQNSLFLIAVFTALLTIYFFIKKSLIESTINKSLLKINKNHFWEEAYFISGIILSLYGLGFLFTMSFLMFPVLIAGNQFKNFKQSIYILAMLSGTAAILGLSASILHSRVSTVPAQVLLLIILMFTPRLFNFISRRISSKK